jgi:DNA repair exonuclease SbcCD nuclease subunit
MKKQLMKAAMFGDIHFGRKANSAIHNQDCLNFVTWFCEQVKIQECDHILFMGDWFESRATIGVDTIDFSIEAAEALDALGIPVFFIIGNHDMHHKTSRNVNSPVMFRNLKNFKLITKPTIEKTIGESGSVLMPYMIHEEYKALKKYLKYENWFGHLELSGFYLTGVYKIKMKDAPTAASLKGPKNIYSGHYHGRQEQKNVCYIGNPFGFDLSDKNDFEKGMAVHDHTNNTRSFVNWTDGPRYHELPLSELIEKVEADTKSKLFTENDTINAIEDIGLDFELHTKYNKEFKEKYNLRGFSIKKENVMLEALKQEVDEDVVELDLEEDKNYSTTDLVRMMLEKPLDKDIDSKMLLKIYEGAKTK